MEIAPGELLDKITIFEVKRSRTRDEGKWANIRAELDALCALRGMLLDAVAPSWMPWSLH